MTGSHPALDGRTATCSAQTRTGGGAGEHAGAGRGGARCGLTGCRCAGDEAGGGTGAAASGVLGVVSNAPQAIAETGTSGTLPFTGRPLWIAVLLGGGLLLGGIALRHASQH